MGQCCSGQVMGQCCSGPVTASLSVCPPVSSFSSLSDQQSDFRSICPTVCLSGLHRSLLLTVTGDYSCLVYSYA